MAVRERKEIADELWLAACNISDKHNYFCCTAIRGMPTIRFFRELFEPRYGDFCDRLARDEIEWMGYYHEFFQSLTSRQDRFFALLLAREIALSGN